MDASPFDTQPAFAFRESVQKNRGPPEYNGFATPQTIPAGTYGPAAKRAQCGSFVEYRHETLPGYLILASTPSWTRVK
jgi:hypothetical protein